MEQNDDKTEVKIYISPRKTFKIKNPLGGFIEFVGGYYSTSDSRLIKHMDSIVKDQPERQIRVKGENDPIPPGQDLTLRHRQLLEWQQSQQNRNPSESEYKSPATAKVASSSDIKPQQGATPRFTPAETKSAAEMLKDRIAANKVKQETNQQPENK